MQLLGETLWLSLLCLPFNYGSNTSSSLASAEVVRFLPCSGVAVPCFAWFVRFPFLISSTDVRRRSLQAVACFFFFNVVYRALFLCFISRPQVHRLVCEKTSIHSEAALQNFLLGFNETILSSGRSKFNFCCLLDDVLVTINCPKVGCSCSKKVVWRLLKRCTCNIEDSMGRRQCSLHDKENANLPPLACSSVPTQAALILSFLKASS